MFYFLIFLNLFIYTPANAPKPINHSLPIFMDGISYDIVLDSVPEYVFDTDTAIISYYITDTMGAGTVEIYSLDSVLIAKGSYINSLGVLREYAIDYNIETGECKTTILDYYRPLKDGVWYYYNNKGLLIKKEYYSNGCCEGCDFTY